MKRKDFIRNSAILAGLPAIAQGFTSERKKPFTIAHLSDIHVKPGKIPEEGMAKALQHLQRNHKADLIFNGGDAIMDALGADKQKTREQFDLFTSILAKENSLPIRHCIGNHDVWGWFIKESKPTNDPQFGKNWVVESFNMPGRYYSFTQNPWHFIVLDSTQLNPEGGYIARVDEEQLEWLKSELKNNVNRYICLISHIPLLSICAGLFFNKTETNGDLLIKRNLMHTDYLTLKKLFLQYPNIKAAISGHIHLQDHVIYHGINYYCNGAVSGNWWNGAFHEFSPAYALMDFYPDGTTRRTMINYEQA